MGDNMSKNIVIKEGGTDRNLTADKLKTNLYGGGTCLWVPEDETQLETKSITENGTYKAEDYGCYGYSQVSVNIKSVGVASGKNPSTGAPTAVTVDPQTGNLVTTELPYSIQIEALPTPPTGGVYPDGYAIDYTDMVVKAYRQDGTLWTHASYPDGIIPVSELTLTETNADYDKVSGEEARTYSAFGEGPWAQPVKAAIGEIIVNNGDIKFIYNNGYVAILNGGPDDSTPNYNYDRLWCSATPGTGQYADQLHSSPRWYNIDVSTPYTYGGKTVYYNSSNTYGYKMYVENNVGVNWRVYPKVGGGLSRAQAAWIVLYGSRVSGANTETIPVKWDRFIDGFTLEASFFISVAPGYGGEGEQGE